MFISLDDVQSQHSRLTEVAQFWTVLVSDKFLSAFCIVNCLKDIHETLFKCFFHWDDMQNPQFRSFTCRSRSLLNVIIVLQNSFPSAPCLLNPFKDFYKTFVRCLPHSGGVWNQHPGTLKLHNFGQDMFRTICFVSFPWLCITLISEAHLQRCSCLILPWYMNFWTDVDYQ